MKCNIWMPLLLGLVMTQTSFGQKTDATFYSYVHDKIHLPQGPISFADEVVSAKRLNANDPSINKALNLPENTLGGPNYTPGSTTGAYTLGCGGEIVVKFTDNLLVDVKGIDLHIFEVGTVEATQLFISKDGETWIDVGKIGGGRTAVDIGPFVQDDDEFAYVKLVDLKECTKINPGADIDAVAAIGSVKKDEDEKEEKPKEEPTPIEIKQEPVVQIPQTPQAPKTPPPPPIEKPDHVEGRMIEFTQTIEVAKKDLTIEVWDRREEDGDRISLILNGKKYVLKNHKIRNKKKSFPLKLDGDTYLTLHAENLGDTPPNTAAVSFDDGVNVQKIELSSDMGKSETILIKVKK